VALRRDGDDGHPLQPLLRAQAQGHLVAVESRDGDVDEDEIELSLGRLADPLQAVRGVHHIEPCRGQQLANQEAVRGVIFDVEHAGHRGPMYSPWAAPWQEPGSISRGQPLAGPSGVGGAGLNIARLGPTRWPMRLPSGLASLTSTGACVLALAGCTCLTEPTSKETAQARAKPPTAAQASTPTSATAPEVAADAERL